VDLFLVSLHDVFITLRNLKLEVQPQPQANAKVALMIVTPTAKNKILATGIHLIVFVNIIGYERTKINENPSCNFKLLNQRWQNYSEVVHLSIDHLVTPLSWWSTITIVISFYARNVRVLK
jgi:hypothetical protein